MNKDANSLIKKLQKENQKLQLENRGLKKVLNSRRFRMAEKIANSLNNVFPKNTKRRYVAGTILRGATFITRIPHHIYDRYILRHIYRLAKNYDKIIVIDSIPWDVQLKQRPHHLAEEFSKLGFFVVYLEPSNFINSFRFIHEGLITINNYKFLTNLIQLQKNKYLILPNTSPSPLEDIKKLREQGFNLIYDFIDEFHEDISDDLTKQLKIWGYLKKHKPELCVVTATKLESDLKNQLGKKQNIIIAKNAVNIEHFNYLKIKKLATPTDMKNILKLNRPIIGFYGALAPWINYDLLNTIAEKHPEWEFVYLGIDYGNTAYALTKRKNVHFLGSKKYKHLPNYAKDFTCAIIPFKHGEIAKATSPVKLFEYMAAGLPTVCTKDLKECSGYQYVHIAKNNDDFERLIKQAILEYKNDSVREILLSQAKNNTWTVRAKTIISALPTKQP